MTTQTLNTCTITLVRRAKDGDYKAYGKIFEKKYEELKRKLSPRLGDMVRAECTIDDVLQEVFLDALQSISTFGNAGKKEDFDAWLFRIGVHRIARYARYHNRDKRIPIYRRTDIDGPIPGHTTDGFDLADGRTAVPDLAARTTLEDAEAQFDVVLGMIEDKDNAMIVQQRLLGLPYKRIVDLVNAEKETQARIEAEASGEPYVPAEKLGAAGARMRFHRVRGKLVSLARNRGLEGLLGIE